MKHAHIELIGLAIRNLDQIPHAQRPDFLDAAAELLDQGHAQRRAQQCRATAALLREADNATSDLNTAFTA